MSVLGRPPVATAVARAMQGLFAVASGAVGRRKAAVFPEFAGDTREITIPTSIAPARAVVYRPAGGDPASARCRR